MSFYKNRRNSSFYRSQSVCCEREARSRAYSNSQQQSPAGLDEDVVEQGQFMFGEFLGEQIQDKGLPEPAFIRSLHDLDDREMEGEVQRKKLMKEMGGRLKMLADKFANTQERKKVQMEAQQIKLSALDRDSFWELLSSMFDSRRNTSERIVVLFTFIADMVIEGLRRHAVADLVRQLVSWSLSFIVERVCSWVQACGGWGMVMSSMLTVKRVIGAAATLVLLYTAYKTIKSWF